MKRKSLLLLITIFFVLTTLVGCGTKVPFETNPESEIKIESIEKSIQNSEKDKEFYEKYFQYRVLGVMPKGLEEMFNALSDDELERKVENGEKLFIINLLVKDSPQEVEQLVLEEIQNYIKASRMEEKELDFVLAPEFEKEKPIEKVKEYMNKNKIEVTEVVLPESFESINTWAYPMRYTYKYVLIGTIDGKSFEKEIVQDFYIGANTDDLHERIEYIK
ncbi:hypothetical protein [Alkaliphilus sp. B6464]|uniref:hypothetical protein n=1 Tax=Alkaliphilus sp. B6464 TaxID=2731219 RepID=UPI001BA52004|nr:hypothetical protein [Alkaliphilus sp. B6464]QUH22038.1 hypothetical protein HYG84_19220 [Alkaliphilus sp. B6464]